MDQCLNEIPNFVESKSMIRRLSVLSMNAYISKYFCSFQQVFFFLYI